MDARLAAEVQSFGGPKPLISRLRPLSPMLRPPPAAGSRSEPALAPAPVKGAWELGDTVG